MTGSDQNEWALFRCIFCQGPVVEAVETPCCSAFCCESCVRPNHDGEWRKCPGNQDDCGSVDPGRCLPNKGVRKLVGNLPWKCPNAGCEELLQCRARKDHEISCGYRVVQCPKGKGTCGSFPARELSDHLKVCPLGRKCRLCGASCPEGEEEHFKIAGATHTILLMDLLLDERKKREVLEMRLDELERVAGTLRSQRAPGVVERPPAATPSPTNPLGSGKEGLSNTSQKEKEKEEHAYENGRWNSTAECHNVVDNVNVPKLSAPQLNAPNQSGHKSPRKVSAASLCRQILNSPSQEIDLIPRKKTGPVSDPRKAGSDVSEGGFSRKRSLAFEDNDSKDVEALISSLECEADPKETITESQQLLRELEAGTPSTAAIDLTEKNAAAAVDLNQKGLEAQKSKRLDDAIHHFEAASRLDPFNCRYFYNMATTLGKLARWEAAIVPAKRAVELNKTERHLTCLGITYMHLRQHDAARKTLSMALEINPKDDRISSALQTLAQRVERLESRKKQIREKKKKQKIQRECSEFERAANSPFARMQEFFSKQSWQNSQIYLANDRLKDIHREGLNVSCSILGSDDLTYRVEVVFQGEDWMDIARSSCTCPGGAGGKCKHVCALVIRWTQSHISTGETQFQAVEAFMSENNMNFNPPGEDTSPILQE